MGRASTWGTVLSVAAAAAVTVAAVDLLAQQLVEPLPPLLEVEDGVAELEASDPVTLVLGSSHARGFSVIKERLAAHLDDPDHLVQVAVEAGKLSSYRWVWEQRLAPVLDDGKQNLRRVLLVTEWWDACAPARVPDTNVPGRAWTASHFLADAGAHGIDDYNRTWLTYQWQSRTRGSILASDRGVSRLPLRLLEVVRPSPPGAEQAAFDAKVRWWNGLVEGGFHDPVCDDGTELAHLEAVVDDLLARRVEVTLVLWPRMPSTLTPKGIETTLARYTRRIRALAEPRGVRVVDLGTTTPLEDHHFMEDFDHTTAEANRILADWGLAGPLAFLLEAPK